MKKTITAVLLAALLLSFLPISALAADISQDNVVQIVSALGIMSGDASGNMNLSGYLTRAQFAKILVCASTYKDSVSATSNVSPFKDVPYTNWAAAYIKAAAQNKWITGYLDGTYRPNNYVTLEEAATAVLKLLGYSSSDFTGSYPYGQLALYRTLGLSKNISAAQGSHLSRRDCMYLIYNMLNTKSKGSSSVYITTLGYSVNSDNEVDFTQLINDTMDGPIIVTSSTWYSALPFSISTASAYRNGTKCTVSDISVYDVVYYSLSMKTVWAYNKKASGTYESAYPNSDYPTSVTVSGTEYEISSTSAAYQLSSLGSFALGDNVTLLLGKDGAVAGVVSASDVNSDIYGVVVSVSKKEYLDANGKSYNAQVLTVADTSGETREYIYETKYLSEGDLVKISFSSGKTVLSSLSRSSLTGVVSAANNTIGKYSIASDIEILDVYNDQYVRVYPSRLSGITLESGNVLFFSLNESGEISRLILNGLTNDMHSFGLVTNVEASDTNNTKTYTYMLNGTKSTITSTTGVYTASSGACMFIYDGSSIESIKNLTAVSIDSLNDSYAKAKSVTYSLSGNVAVYVKNSSGYYLSSPSIVADTDAYSLTAYYDKLENSGGRIRVIIAVPK